MDITQITALLEKAVYVLVKMGGPIMVAALVVGIIMSILQAVTQIQEQSLAFIPKLLVVFGLLVFLFPHMFFMLSDFTHELFDLAIRSSA